MLISEILDKKDCYQWTAETAASLYYVLNPGNWLLQPHCRLHHPAILPQILVCTHLHASGSSKIVPPTYATSALTQTLQQQAFPPQFICAMFVCTPTPTCEHASMRANQGGKKESMSVPRVHAVLRRKWEKRWESESDMLDNRQFPFTVGGPL